MLIEWMEPLLSGSSLQVLALLCGVFLLLTFVLITGVSWLFSRHRTSRAETEKLLKSLRRSTRRKFVFAIALTLALETLLKYAWGPQFDDPRLGSAAYIGILLTALSDLFMASSIVLVISVFTRPITQVLGGFLDLLQSLVLAVITGWAVRNLADFEFFKSVVLNIPIAIVLAVSSIIYSVAGTTLWVFDNRSDGNKE